MNLVLLKEKRRRGEESGGGRRRGREGDERRDGDLTLEIRVLERDPRHAIFLLNLGEMKMQRVEIRVLDLDMEKGDTIECSASFIFKNK